MQARELLKYINNPALLDKQSIPLLQQLVKDFPYFQSGHILLSIASKKWDTSVYQQSIKKTAIVVANRSHLYNLIHSPETLTEEEVIPATENIDIVQSQPKKEVIVSEKVTAVEKTEKLTVINTGKVIPANEEEVEKEVEKALVASILDTEITSASDEINKKTEPKPANFNDWLSFLKKNNGESYSEIEEKVNKQKLRSSVSEKEQNLKSKQKQKDLIDKIIDLNPGALKQKEEQKFFKSDFKAKESLLENEHLVSETLAQIYASQGNINKAIRAYEILSLKFPQKSVYFASLIQKLKNNQ